MVSRHKLVTQTKKIDTIMTDAATKNFQIKKSIGSANASTLQKTHN